jgi:phosphoesterase RecJ-like protein
MEPEIDAKGKETIEKIYGIMKDHERFIVTTHYNIDGDGLGSEIAVYLLLRRMGKKVEMVNQDKTPPLYRFLPCTRLIRNKPSESMEKPDVCIVVDCGNLERTGETAAFAKKSRVIVNIDHHFSNTGFGTVDFIGDRYSSTGEMVYFIAARHGRIQKKQAGALYASIITDTGKFVHSMGPCTLKVVQKLIEAGADTERIAGKIYMEKPLKSLRLLSLALSTLRCEKDIKVCWMTVDRRMYALTGTDSSDTEGFVEMINGLRESRAAFLIKDDGQIRVSLRSKGGYDVEKVARKFGGGGHKQASGCRFPGGSSLIEVAGKLLEEMRKQNGRDNNSK